jgi:hypothetical protein
MSIERYPELVCSRFASGFRIPLPVYLLTTVNDLLITVNALQILSAKANHTESIM